MESGYEHPHGFVRLKASEKTWHVVLAPPSRMERRQLPRKSLAAGTEAIVVGYPSRTDPQEMRAERITRVRSRRDCVALSLSKGSECIATQSVKGEDGRRPPGEKLYSFFCL